MENVMLNAYAQNCNQYSYVKFKKNVANNLLYSLYVMSKLFKECYSLHCQIKPNKICEM